MRLDPRTSFTIRLRDGERRLVYEAAAAALENPTTWVRMVTVAAARRAVAEAQQQTETPSAVRGS